MTANQNDTSAPLPCPAMVAWESPANIALVKYWGKHPVQLPMNPSISFVLRESVVRLHMSYTPVSGVDAGLHAFALNGKPNEKFRRRIAGFLESLYPVFPFLRGMALSIQSESTFPHSAGIASSAAAFSALALCLCEMERTLDAGASIHRQENLLADTAFLKKASAIARLGSGSACRSLESGFVVWGKTPSLETAHDEYAVRVNNEHIAPAFLSLRDAVLIVDDTEKKVSSSAGHELMQHHAYREARTAQAEDNLALMLQALKTGDEPLFFRVLENEALGLHGLMMSSVPGYILMKPNTITLLDKIRDFRDQHQIGMGFTMDAGPNIHLIYFNRDAKQVREFIAGELSPLCREGRWIDDAMGDGPRRI